MGLWCSRRIGVSTTSGNFRMDRSLRSRWSCSDASPSLGLGAEEIDVAAEDLGADALHDREARRRGGIGGAAEHGGPGPGPGTERDQQGGPAAAEFPPPGGGGAHPPLPAD